jgi:hypothetical protein
MKTIQYDALGRVLGEFITGDFPGQGTPMETQHTFAYEDYYGFCFEEIDQGCSQRVNKPKFQLST